MSLAAANREYFDDIHNTYDSKPFFVKFNQQVTSDLHNRLDWLGIPLANASSSPNAGPESVRQLDYACGTGLMSRIFGPYVTQTLGIDISPNMVATFNARARIIGLPATASVGDLLNKEDPSPKAFSTPEWHGFDLATAGFAFHHFEDPVLAARRLKERLRPGGVLLISDFLEGGDLKAGEDGEAIEGSEGNWAVHHHHHGHGHEHGHGKKGHSHHGHDHGHDHGKKEDERGWSREKMQASAVRFSFTVEGVKKFFTEAGFLDVDVVTMDERAYMEFGGQKLWRTALFARGRRPVEARSEL